MAGVKPIRTEFGIHQRLESCDLLLQDNGSVTGPSQCV